jgi:hypothetical protein
VDPSNHPTSTPDHARVGASDGIMEMPRDDSHDAAGATSGFRVLENAASRLPIHHRSAAR